MATTAAENNVPDEEEDEAQRLQRLMLQREHEEAMEQLLLQQEAEHDHAHGHGRGESDFEHHDGAGLVLDPGAERDAQQGFQGEQLQQEPAVNGDDAGDDIPPQLQLQGEEQQENGDPTSSSTTVHKKITYRQGSFLAAAALLLYAFRTRQQYYLAAVFISSSKWAYVILGNALIAAAISVFDFTVSTFLKGLRLQEAEGLQDFFRWNVTETCLALTMFRSELHLYTAVEFLLLILVKCLHQVAILREQHIRMTQDAVVPWEVTRGAPPRQNQNNTPDDPAQPEPPQNNFALPVLQAGHVRLLAFMVVLQFLDLYAAQRTVQHLLANGPSVNILFSFEAAILLVSAWSHLLLWHLNVLDSLLQYGHEHSVDTAWHGFFRRLLHPWREYKATLVFAVELQAQAVQFLFYLTFFSIVLTYYGMPINLFREVYMSFAALKERLVAFFTYRQLMASMNRFHNATEEELQQAGPICIICRDEMTVHDCKRLPVCRHIFHKSCLREWLVQQQSCPTCRADIATMQVQEAAAEAAAQREAAIEAAMDQLQQQQQEDQDDQQRNEPWGRGGHGLQARAAAAPAADVDAAEPTPTPESQPKQAPTTPTTPDGVVPSSPRDEEQKLGSEKKVRFKVVEVSDHTTGSPAAPSPFPAMYKVTADDGAPVSREDGTVFRTIPAGSLVLCNKIKEEKPEKETATTTPQLLLGIPDGWIPRDAVKHVLTISKK